MRFFENFKSCAKNARLRRSTLLATFAVLGIVSAEARSAPTINPNIPDFYQHQFLFRNPGGVNGWEKTATNVNDNIGVGGGWCRPTALVDTLYSLRAKGYTNLLPAFNNAALTWQNAYGAEVVNLRNSQAGVNPIRAYVTAAGYGDIKGPRANGLALTQYAIDANGKISYKSSSGNYVRIKDGAGVQRSAIDVYGEAITNGDAVNIRFTPGTNRSPLRWWGDFHYVSGVGVDLATNTIYFADPDSNKGSADNNAGWNFTMLDANVAGRRYGAADVLPIGPVNPAAAGFSSTYGSEIISGGNRIDPNNAGNDARYKGVVMASLETITPVKAGKFARAGAPNLSPHGSVTPFINDIDLDSQEADDIDKILILPQNTELAPGYDDTMADSDDTWSDTELPDNFTDPFGEVRPFGGIEYDINTDGDPNLDGLENGEIDTATIGTTTDFSAFDVLMHDAGTNEWLVQAIGGLEDDFGDQSGDVPEPTALATILSVAALGMARRRRGNMASATV